MTSMRCFVDIYEVECLVSVYPPALLNQWLDVYPGKVNEDYNYTNNAEKTDTDKHSHYKVV